MEWRELHGGEYFKKHSGGIVYPYFSISKSKTFLIEHYYYQYY